MQPLAAQPRKNPEKQAQPDAEQDAGGQRKIKRGVFTFVDDVTGQPAQPKWQFPAKIEKHTYQREQSAQHDQGPAEFAKRFHKVARKTSVAGPKERDRPL